MELPPPERIATGGRFQHKVVAVRRLVAKARSAFFADASAIKGGESNILVRLAQKHLSEVQPSEVRDELPGTGKTILQSNGRRGGGDDPPQLFLN